MLYNICKYYSTRFTMAKEKSKQIILDYFSSNSSITIKEFQQLTGKSSRTTFYNTINSLKADGYDFEEVFVDTKTKAYILKDKHNLSAYKKATSDDFYKYLIMETLNRNRTGMLLENPLSRAEKRSRTLTKHNLNKDYLYLFDKLYDINSDSYDDAAIPINIGESKFRELLSDLVDEGYILAVTHPNLGIIYTPNNKENVYSTASLVYILQLLNQIPNEHKNYPILSSAMEKIAFELFHSDDSIVDDQNYIIYGKKRKTFSSLTEDLSILGEANYKDFVVNLTYIENGIRKSTLFAVGKVVFSEMSSEAYIIGRGKSFAADEGSYMFLPLSSLQKANATNLTNTEYRNPIYDSFIKNMLDISVDRPVHLKANVFAEFLGTSSKLQRLKDCRYTSAKLLPKHEKDNLVANIYEDDISDVDKIKSYLLGFGRACTVLEPASLVDEIQNDIKLALKNYTEEGFNVE